MNYGEILSTAWKKLWQEKIMFAFGILPMLPGMLFTLFIFGWMLTVTEEKLDRFFHSIDQSSTFPTFFLVVAGITFFMIVISWLLTPYGWAGISQGIIAADQGKTGMTFEHVSQKTFSVYWRVFGFLTIIWLGYFAIIFIPIILGFLTAGIGFLCMFPLILIMLPVGLILFAGIFMGIAAIAADDLSLGDSFVRVWGLLKANFWPLILMALIMYLIQMAIGMIAAIPMYIGQFVIMFIPDITSMNPLDAFRMFGWLFAIMIPITYIGSALGMTYNQAAWTVTYLRLTHKAQSQLNSDQPIQA